MLRYVSPRTRILTASYVLAGTLFAALLVTSSARAAPAAGGSTLKPTVAAAGASSTHRAAHVGGVHHRRHARTHPTEPNLRAHEITAVSLPVPAPAPKRPRTNHRANALAIGHRHDGARANGAAGMPVSAAGALSIAVLGACVHQRHRLRPRFVSQPLESRGPPRAGPLSNLASPLPRAARESTADVRRSHPTHAGSPLHRVNSSPVPRALPISNTSRSSAPSWSLLASSCPASSRVPRPIPRCTGASGPHGAPGRGRLLRAVDPSKSEESR